MSVLSSVRRTIREHDLARRGTRVAVALSGGPDSVALTHAVAALAAEGELILAGAAHFNHQLRDTASRDEAFCRTIAVSLGVPIEIGRGDVAALARVGRVSIEHAAHEARYAFLEEARQRLRADVVALGHTRDDQAETFLLRLIRGAGARGLAAMHPRNGRFVRPLLDCRRADLVSWLNTRGIEYVSDETNDDVAIDRNRVRAELIPLLRSSFNPAIVDVLADAAELARGEWLWLEEAAESALRGAGEIRHDTITLDSQRVAAMPLALQRAVVWRAMSTLGTRPVSFAHVNQAVRLLQSGSDGALSVPGLTVNRLGGRLVLKVGASRRAAGEDTANLFEYSLSIPGEVLVPEAGGLLTAEEQRPGDPVQLIGPDVAVVRRDLCGAGLTVRSRRPGDRLRPVGLGGSRKLQDVFVDRKIARADRDRIPVVVDETGRVLWVAGYGISEEFRITDAAQPMLILRFKVVGGPV